MIKTVLIEILGALEFAAFLAAIGAACAWATRLPAYQRLHQRLFPEDINYGE